MHQIIHPGSVRQFGYDETAYLRCLLLHGDIRLSDTLRQVKRNAKEYEQQRLATGK